MSVRGSRRPTAVTSGLGALVLAVLVLLPACSVIGSSPAHEVRQAFLSTASAGPSRVGLTATTTVAGQEVDVTGDGVVDVAARSADLTLQLPTIGELKTVIVGETAYARIPSMFAMFLPGFGQWASIGLDRLSTLPFLGPLAQLGPASNPVEALRYLEAVRDDARVVGREPVEGIETTRYAATIDLEATPAAQDPALRADIDRLRSVLGTAALPVEVWIDDDGRVRRASQTVVADPSAAGARSAAGSSPTSTTMSVTFREYGLDARIAPPPPAEVTDIGALLPTG